MCRVRNPFEDLPGFEGLALDLRAWSRVIDTPKLGLKSQGVQK
jgi:hypothetical protein